MSKIKNISKQNMGVINTIKISSSYAKVKLYEYKGAKYFYCITKNGKLHISGSTPIGPVGQEDLIYVFNQVTNKLIFNFEFLRTNQVLYLLEIDNPISQK